MSLSDKYLANAWPSVTKSVTLGLVVRRSQVSGVPYNDNCANWRVYMKVAAIKR